jgi:hypothetical protein
MKKNMTSFVATMLGIGLAVLGAEGQERKVHFALTVGVIVGGSEDGFGGAVGPGARVDFNLSPKVMISPEVSLFWGGVSPGCTINARFGRGFIGLGCLALSDEGLIWHFKGHIGVKGGHWTAAASFLKGRWITAVGLTAGYIF